MKQGCMLLVLALFLSAPISADTVESFQVGAPFDAGVSGPIVGVQDSTDNFFDTGFFETGLVAATNARSILAGSGDVLFTSLADGTTTLDFDMGVGLQLTTLDAALSYSEVRMTGLQADVDADNFKFEFRTILLDGSTVTDLSDVSITSSSGTITFTNLDVGLYQAEISGIVGSADILFTGTGGNFVRGVNFKSITPDFETNEVRVLGSRTLVGVPEPGSLLFLGIVGALATLRRRKPVF